MISCPTSGLDTVRYLHEQSGLCCHCHSSFESHWRLSGVATILTGLQSCNTIVTRLQCCSTSLTPLLCRPADLSVISEKCVHCGLLSPAMSESAVGRLQALATTCQLVLRNVLLWLLDEDVTLKSLQTSEFLHATVMTVQMYT